jgi:hypothetical protein
MTRNDSPEPEARGAMAPPNRRPPTAVGADTPEPPPAPRPHRHSHTERTVHIGPDLRKFVSRALTAIDEAAEVVAVELGLQRSSNRPPPPDARAP